MPSRRALTIPALRRYARWREIFGSPDVDYEPETYRPRPYSRSFVRHLPNWYAQAHPDEDFAETFAVWLASPPEQWRERYRGWLGRNRPGQPDSYATNI